MTSLAAPPQPLAPPTGAPAPGRPLEIEEWTNRRVIHPLSRGLAALLIPTGISPNAVSIMGAAAAAVAGGAIVLLAWPADALVGFALLVLWHVLDGADGVLARRTGRASPNGELVDGICDHLGQAAVYVSLALVLQADFGPGAWLLAAGAALSRAMQASAYERCRRNYRRWVYGAGWIRQTLAAVEAEARTPWQRLKAGLGGVYLATSTLVSADDAAVEAAMSRQVAGERGAEARQLYRERMLPLVKRASVLSANWRTCVAGLSLLAGTPLWLILYELIGLNLVLLVLVQLERAANRRLLADLPNCEVSGAAV